MYEATRKHLSGFCGAGHHEGMRVPGPSGKLNKTCLMIETCNCKNPQCHTFYDRLFESTGAAEREPVDNSGYVTDHGGFTRTWMEPTVVPMAPILSSSRVELPPDTLESAAPGTLPPVKRVAYADTSSGRTARGQLGDWVNQACITWLADEEKQSCTPQYLSEVIAEREGVSPPSTGAINSVFERWIRYGYAVIERKPTRFIGFTEAGVKLGLDALKARAKRGSNVRV